MLGVSPLPSASSFLVSILSFCFSYRLLQHKLFPNQQLTQPTVTMPRFLWVRIWEWRSQGVLAQGFSWRLLARSRCSEGLKGLTPWLLQGASVPGHMGLPTGLLGCSQTCLPQGEQSKQERKDGAIAFYVCISEVTHPCFQHILFVRSESFPAVHTRGEGPSSAFEGRGTEECVYTVWSRCSFCGMSHPLHHLLVCAAICPSLHLFNVFPCTAAGCEYCGG